ncbi:HDOD domain-containing protein [Desulfobacter latus]|uniref:histidine kinase n=1 Tax=Desulfobacter latus TaxID=2292 RepID=A0A850SRA4_9BACT|nr:HDOD domain-containing protein [Desulfobacter latus]NWH03689.1 HDOD domain-containing protein [Desulfobacter latus]
MKHIFEKIKRSGALPQLPQVMLQLIRACGREKTDIDEVTQIICRDAALTAKLLTIIASPHVNLSKQVTTIKSAVVYLGMDTVRNIAISSSAMQFFKFPNVTDNFNINRFWYHSYKCAVLAQRIACEENQVNPDQYFLAGLLHDIGTLVLMATFPKAYKEIEARVNQGQNEFDAQADILKLDGPTVSAWLFNQWHLNPMASDAVQFLSQPLARIAEELTHVKILFMANLMAEPESTDVAQDSRVLTDMPDAVLDEIAIQAENEVHQMAQSLNLVMGAPEQGYNLLAEDVKDLSLCFGTLDNLLKAKDVKTVLETIQRGLEIIFHIPRIFFFLKDKEKNLLTGTCAKEDRHYNIVTSIALAMDNSDSLVAKSVKTGKITASMGQENPAVSDTQIIRILETPALYAIPILGRNGCSGTMVIGVDSDLTQILDKNNPLLALFSRQTGICLENLNFHGTYAKDISDKKMVAYATLTDKVVHEINNPVTIIKNYLETLKLKLPEKHPAQEELTVIKEEMSRVSSLLEGLTSFSKPRVGGTLETIDLNQMCRRVLAVLQKSILLPRQIRIQTDLDDTMPKATLDTNGLKQVIINLVKNAAEALEKGSEIQFKTRLVPGSAKVLIDEKRKLPGLAEITIEDNGPGMPSHIRERLFEPYNSSKAGASNSGLGLSIVHAIIKKMQGRITCDSSRGRGTCFTILIPLAPDTGPRPPKNGIMS